MTRRKRILFAALIACGVIIFMVCLSRADFSPVPKAGITNVDAATVGQILCQKEIELANMTIVGGVGQNTPFKKAVDEALAHNKSTMVAEYELELGFGAKSHCKDTIFLDTRQPDQIILSVKCKRKDDTHVWNSGVSGLFGFSRYKRDYGREYVIMSETVRQLQADHQARIEWLGKWRPENSKRNWPDGPPGAPSYPAKG